MYFFLDVNRAICVYFGVKLFERVKKIRFVVNKRYWRAKIFAIKILSSPRNVYPKFKLLHIIILRNALF